MVKNNDEVIRMLNAYNKGAKEGDCWYEHDVVLAVYNGEEWIKNEPLKLSDLEEVNFMDSSIPLEKDQMLLYDGVPEYQTVELEAGEGIQFKIAEPPTTFCIYNPNGDIMVNIDIVTGNIEFGETYDFDEAAQTFWEGVAMMSPWIEPPCTRDNEELQNQYAAMDASFEDEELTDWPMEYKQEFSSLEDDVEATVDPFDAGRSLIE